LDAYGKVHATYLFDSENAGKRSSERGKAVEIFVPPPGRMMNTGWQLMADPAGKASE
jgi:hypothetical protein